MLCFFSSFVVIFAPQPTSKCVFACRSLLAVQASVLELSPPPLLFSSILLFRLSSVARKRFSPLLPSDLLRRNGWRTSSSSCFASSRTTCACLQRFPGGGHPTQILRSMWLYFSFVAGLPILLLYQSGFSRAMAPSWMVSRDCLRTQCLCEHAYYSICPLQSRLSSLDSLWRCCCSCSCSCISFRPLPFQRGSAFTSTKQPSGSAPVHYPQRSKPTHDYHCFTCTAETGRWI